jgi:NAD-dependent dihydropyrimidine dehydrogenase PreA subunit
MKKDVKKVKIETKNTPQIKIDLCNGCCLCEHSASAPVLEFALRTNSSGIYHVRAAQLEDCIACGNCCTICPMSCSGLYGEISDGQSELRPAERYMSVTMPLAKAQRMCYS